MISCRQEPVLIVQVTDPQMGFQTDNADMTFESEKLSEAVSAINSLKPDAVVFTGDLVHNASDEVQWKEFTSQASKIDSRIKTFFLPGNHDVKTNEGQMDISPFSNHFGKDRFSERIKGVRIIGLNSNYIKSDDTTVEEERQFAWLTSSLDRNDGISLIFAHHPFFINDKDEPDEYFNILTSKRKKYFDLFEDCGADAVFCGHKHSNSLGYWNDIPMVTTSALGRQLGIDESGVRVIVCDKGKVYHRYLALDEIPASRQALTDLCLKTGSADMNQAPYAIFHDGMIRYIEADGWVEDFLKTQVSGMSGHPESMSYPYDSALWAGDISRNTESYGSDWWRYEQTAYYTDGLLRLGYILGDTALVDKGQAGIEYTLDNVSENGMLGKKLEWTWPFSVFFRAMQAYAEYNSSEEEIAKALNRHYLTYGLEELKKWRNVLSIEGMLWTYGRTHDERLLRMSELAWNAGEFTDLTPKECAEDDKLFMHGVTCMEELKLPVLLYAYTGKQEYLAMARNVVRRLDRDDMLPDGVPASAEALVGSANVTNSHETCDIVDFTWTLGYLLMTTGEAEWADRIEKAVFNAGLGAITKDFKALQYFSSVNQVIATGTSNHNDFFHGSTWMAYRPTHETECCAGNVHRLMPNYVSRMWMTDADDKGVVAALYGPSEYEFTLSDGSRGKVRENTGYPYSDTIDFEFELPHKSDFPFTFRVPAGCTKATVSINGSEIPGDFSAGSFHTLERTFKDGDIVSLDFDFMTEAVQFKDQGVYFRRGPLVYAYPVPTKVEIDDNIYANMNGKVPGHPDFKCLSMTPDGNWNYALCEGPVTTDTLSITIPVKQIDWDLEEGRYTPKMPKKEEIKVLSDSIGHIRLVPYGRTELRVTVFPSVK